MKSFVSAATGLFCLLLCISKGNCQPVPDGVVYTEVEKVLHEGEEGTLTCRFYRDPLAVYWKKGTDPEFAHPVISLHEGNKEGPGFTNGRFDIDGQYSLIFKNVSKADKGRYICRVSNYLGILLHNYTDVTVIGIPKPTTAAPTVTPSMAAQTTMSQPERGNVTGIVIGIVTALLVLIGLFIGTTLLIMKRRNRDVEYSRVSMKEIMNRGTISYLELWEMVKYAKKHGCIDKIEAALKYLNKASISVSTTQKTDRECYEELCKWKNDGAEGSGQKEKIFHVCETMHLGLDDVLNELKYFSGCTSEQMSDDDLAHIVLEIIDPANIAELLRILGLDHTILLASTCSNNLHDATAAALTELRKWRDGPFEMNPAVELSLALETLKFSPNEKDFFRVPDTHKTPLAKDEIRKYVRAIAGKHCRRLIGALDLKAQEDKIKRIIDENETTLFETTNMVNDWLEQQVCSNFTKRCKLRNASDVQAEKGSADPMLPSDAELRQLQSHVTQSVCRKLNIDYASSDEGNFKSLCCWRDRTATKDRTEKYMVLLKAFKEDKLEGLLPVVGGKFVYKVECVDLAFQLIMEDILPFSKALGIRETKLGTYRPKFFSSHLEMGTIALLIKFFTSSSSQKLDVKMRQDLCHKLRKLGYPSTAQKSIIAYNISYGEMCSIADALCHDNKDPSTTSRDYQKTGQSKLFEHEIKDGDKLGTDTKETVLAVRGNGVAKKTDDKENAPPSKDAESDTVNNPRTESQLLDEKHGEDSKSLPDNKKLPQMENDATNAPSESYKTENNETDDQKMSEPEESVTKSELLQEAEHLSEPHIDIHVSTEPGVREKVFRELKQILQMTDVELDQNHTCGSADILGLLRVWKEKPRLQPFNYRASLADGLKRVKRDRVAADAAKGEHKGNPSTAFMHDIVSKMDTDQRMDLGKLLGFSTKKGEWRDSAYKFAEKLHTTMREREASMKKMKPGGFKDTFVRFTEIEEQLFEFNERLVKHGFLDLAREMMIIETQLLYEKGEGIFKVGLHK